MKNPIRPATILCLIALALLPCKSSFGATSAQPATAAPMSPGDQASASNDQLLVRLESISDANPQAKMFGGNLSMVSASATTSGEYLEVERTLLQLKAVLSANPEAVGIIEQLLTRYQAAEIAARAKREAQIDVIIKELTDKFNAHAPLKDYDDLLKQITDLQASAELAYARGQIEGNQRLTLVQTFISQWQDYLAAKEAGNSQRAASAISQLVQISTQFTAIPRSVLINIQNTPIAETDTTAAKADFDKLSAKVVAAVNSAKVPADLDAMLAELGAYHPTPSPYGQYPFVSSVENLKVFVRKWQEYLAARQSGRSDLMMAALRELTNSNYDNSFFPRSKILVLQQDTVHVDKKSLARDGVLMEPNSLTLDNIKAFNDQLSSINFQGVYQSYLTEHHESQLQSAVSRLESIIIMVKAGDNRSGIFATQNIAQFIGESGDYSDVLYSLFDQVSFDALRAEIAVPDDLKPAPHERFGAFLKRLVATAADRKDWRLAYRAAEIRRTINQSTGSLSDEEQDYEAFHALTQGINLDDAGQWTDAVVAYKSALNSTGPDVPIKEIGDRLARIRRDHPDDYQKGLLLPDYPSLFSKVLEMRQTGMQVPQYVRPPIPGSGDPYGPPSTTFPQAKIQVATPTATGK
jgi:hypothetical protein